MTRISFVPHKQHMNGSTVLIIHACELNALDCALTAYICVL